MLVTKWVGDKFSNLKVFCPHSWSSGETCFLEKHAFVKLPLITGFTEKLAAHFSKPDELAKDTNYALWQARSHRRFLYSTGERFFFNGQNALIAYLWSKEIRQLMKNQELKIQLAINAGLTCPIREFSMTSRTELCFIRCFNWIVSERFHQRFMWWIELNPYKIWTESFIEI